VPLYTQYKTTRLTATSSHCLAALPTKMSTFNCELSHAAKLQAGLPTCLHQKKPDLVPKKQIAVMKYAHTKYT